MLPINLASDTSPKVESASSSRTKRDTDTPSASGTNAFAATLATAMHAPKAAPPKKDGANSELDAHSRSAETTSAAGAVGVGDSAGGATGPRAASTDGSTATSAVDVGAQTAKPAFAAAAEARAAAADTPVDSANADAEALNPDFRARLGRVITRMHDEFGKDVQLVEGFRTQSRQDFLYDQGRTRPGDVITWTKSSKHTLGLAADVTIDGAYADAAGFRQLAQVAAQEGLRTLGAKDPGHIELPTHGGAGAWGTVATDSARMDDNVSRAIGIALDQGSALGDSASDTDSSMSNFNGLLSRVGRASPGVPPIRMPMMSGGGSMAGGTGSNGSQQSFGDSGKDVAKSADPAQVAAVANVATVAQVAQVAHAGAVMQTPQPIVAGAQNSTTVSIANGSEAADKVGRLLDARDATPAQPLSHVTLNIDNASGGSDRITVQLRGGAVDTAISLGDPNRADRMSLRVGELQHALEQHGLDATAISVASTAGSAGPGWNPRQSSDQSAQTGRQSLNHRDNRQDADGTRQRSRREQQGGRPK